MTLNFTYESPSSESTSDRMNLFEKPLTYKYGSQPQQKMEKTISLSGFEGPEKLLEIWFQPPGYTQLGLRSIGRDTWAAMLSIVQCQILSVIANEHADAYLLSESSMFVYPKRLILKTCGTTTLLNAIPQMLQLARSVGLETIEAFFYSRKAFLFPDRQEWPHGNWGDEVAYLDTQFPANDFDTSGYVLGKINGDHWCLYTCTPCVRDFDGNMITPNIELEQLTITESEPCSDVTLEVLMTHLDPAKVSQFWRTPAEHAESKSESNKTIQKHKLKCRIYVFFTNENESGIADIHPEAIIDDYVFDPCGYSLNGLLGDAYFTVHVTPEDVCSYASFETTVPFASQEEVAQLIKKVTDIFNPGKFSTTLFSRHPAMQPVSPIESYKVKDSSVQFLGNWQLYFAHYQNVLFHEDYVRLA